MNLGIRYICDYSESLIYRDTDSMMFVLSDDRLWNNTMCSEDIHELNEWKIESTNVHRILLAANSMPDVLCDLVISYIGPAYANVLIPLGSNRELRRMVRECSSPTTRNGMKAAQAVMKILTELTNIYPIPYTRREINVMISSYGTYSINPDHETSLKQYAMIYRIVLIYFLGIPIE